MGARGEMSTRHIGWCPVCEKDFKVRGGRLVHHGYLRPGVGYIIGDCPGVGFEPYELGTGALIYYDDYVVKPRVDEAASNLRSFTRPGGPRRLPFEDYDIETRRVRRDDRRNPVIVWLTREESDQRVAQLPSWERDRYDWERRLRIVIANVESELRHWEREQERVRRLVLSWAPQPLRTVDEEVRRQEQSRAERERTRTVERDQKIAGEVEKIQKRIDSAVRGKNSATLADIFTSDKLVKVSGYRLSRAQAIDLLERDYVWRAFGLLSLEGKALDDELHAMTWGRWTPRPGGGYDTHPYLWPAELGGGTAKTRR